MFSGTVMMFLGSQIMVLEYCESRQSCSQTETNVLSGYSLFLSPGGKSYVLLPIAYCAELSAVTHCGRFLSPNAESRVQFLRNFTGSGFANDPNRLQMSV